MYEVCMSADKRVEPTFNNPQSNNSYSHSPNPDHWDINPAEAPASVMALDFDTDEKSGIAGLLLKSGMVILLMLTFYVGHMIYKNATYESTHATLEKNNQFAATEGDQGEIRKIDLTQTASVRKVQTVTFKKPSIQSESAGIQNRQTQDKIGSIAEQAGNSGAQQKFHTIESGDTISHIGRLYKVSTAKIMEINNITDPRTIKPGMKIVVPQ